MGEDLVAHVALEVRQVAPTSAVHGPEVVVEPHAVTEVLGAHGTLLPRRLLVLLLLGRADLGGIGCLQCGAAPSVDLGNYRRRCGGEEPLPQGVGGTWNASYTLQARLGLTTVTAKAQM